MPQPHSRRIDHFVSHPRGRVEPRSLCVGAHELADRSVEAADQDVEPRRSVVERARFPVSALRLPRPRLEPVVGVLAVFVFRKCDAIARERGMIDMVTNY